jgi:hypothetical protein
MWQELIKKIELQSVLVLFITLAFGSYLLNGSNDFSTPRGILGTISISVGLLYTLISFFSNNIKESYKDVIAEYKNTINTLRGASKDIQKSYQDTISSTSESKSVGQYKIISETDSGTRDE